MRHLKKEDGIPLWRKDIQYDFLRLVFFDKTRCFTKYSDHTKDHTFAEIYIDAMAKSSKCSKILKEKLLQDTEGAICMAMVCLLVNVGRMNTTLNFFPEMRAQLRTYHSIPALQAHQDPNAYKQLQDAPRLKSILKGATEDEPQPSTIDEIKAARMPRTNPVNLIFVLSQFAPKISEVHFAPPRDFFDLVMRPSLSSASRARAFLWLVWWYLESDFSAEASQNNPFGPGQPADGDKAAATVPTRVPQLESLNEDQVALENVDTEEEKHYGEVKRKERIAILASEPSPAMTALKRSRNQKGLASGLDGSAYQNYRSDDDDGGDAPYSHQRSGGRGHHRFNQGSDYTRSPSPAASRGMHSATKGAGDMRINNLLNNDDAMSEASPPRSDPLKKGPGRGNWRRNRPDQGTSSSGQQPRLLPNNNGLSFVNDGPLQSSGYQSLAPNSSGHRDHVPTPSYQAQKRHRGVTSHQSAIISARKQQIDYTLDRRIVGIHSRARYKREAEGPLLRAWKRIRAMQIDYDSEEEVIKIRKARERAEKDEDGWRSSAKGKDANGDLAMDDADGWRRSKIFMAGFVKAPAGSFGGKGDPEDVGEEARSVAKAFERCARRLDKWLETDRPGDAMIRRRRMVSEGEAVSKKYRRGRYGSGRASSGRHRSSTGRVSEAPAPYGHDEEDGAAELDEEDRELLGEVDVDESEEDEDEEMADD